MTAKLNVNIDHVATIREARKTIEPSIITAAVICEQAGADGITVHIRGDRRHIQDRDIELLREVVTTYLNVEMAATDEMLEIASMTKPDAVSLVPEKPNEVTTEGGLDVIGNQKILEPAVKRLRNEGIFVSAFVDPITSQIEAAQSIGCQQVELCTGEYAEMTLGAKSAHGEGAVRAAREIERIRNAAVHGSALGLKIAAGHGLTYRNVGALAAIPEITEFNIGHNIVSRAVFTGLYLAVEEMIGKISKS
ncbi:MAG: pyridoxine 5'-phosphate synthase [Acidobacteria bacterium]|nr:MAG: pyridoxine 5'-phosphate synthase [Acidobacteriota bacterium]REK01823.1 MAG: pyridoxine 5'-phosphate synthase [Acidobacteriota bacterium]REK14779.1 MAG: pyridoxine 5'-phosphate synthase [Acidobacteriota bacterium]REK45494.1 MAG: pyridoxine 5'-phosphate synthase [Acidobacteriota bacterium]